MDEYIRPIAPFHPAKNNKKTKNEKSKTSYIHTAVSSYIKDHTRTKIKKIKHAKRDELQTNKKMREVTR